MKKDGPRLRGWSFAVCVMSLTVGACGTPFSARADGASGSGPVSSAGASDDSNGHAGSAVASAGDAAAPSTGMSPKLGNDPLQGVSPSQGGAAGATAQPDGGAEADAGDECPCVAPTPTCEAGRCLVRGPSMVKANGFYIDSTEVTRAQYASFLAARAGDTSGQAEECAWNSSFDPAFDPALGTPSPNYPVTDVDYCDAAAFCAWANKRLCGRIGGGQLALAEVADASKSQWFAACAGPKAQAYPYGVAYQSGACNDKQASKALVPVGSKITCEGYYPGLFDMLGNAQEWTAACNARSGPMDGCERIGGSYLTSTVCSQSGLAMRGLQDPAVGFRCCSQ